MTGQKMTDTMYCDSPVGRLLLAGRDGVLVGLWIEGQKYYRESLKGETGENAASPILNQAKQWLERYFRGERPSVSELKLAPEGSEFRREVWKILCGIPYGQVTTYGEIAEKIAASRGLSHSCAQAVGGAVGHNPISIIIPGHRVVGADGSLTGYAGGVEKKRSLLIREGADMEKLHLPSRGTAL